MNNPNLNNPSKNRIRSIDIARVLCLFWIVGIWHFINYFDFRYKEELLDCSGITAGVLSCFTFLSGLFLGKKEMTPVDFYKKRFARFYPLYFISALSLFLVGWFDSFKQFIYTILGLSSFVLPQPKTLWYFSMLMVFYLITPLIKYKTIIIKGRADLSNILSIIVNGIIIYLLFYLLNEVSRIDPLFLKYYWPYLIGILTPLSVVNYIDNYKYIICPISLCLSYFSDFYFQDYFLRSQFIGITYLVFIISASSIIDGIINDMIRKFFVFLSYSSMSAYLFHRQIHGSFLKALGYSKESLLEGYWYLVIIITVFVVAYFIQKIYDRLIERIINR